MPRLTMIERESLPKDQQRFYDAVKAIRRRPISGPFIVAMNSSPDLATRFAHLGHYFHSRGQADESIVSIRVRSFISLIGSRALDAPYEWAAWVNWALEAGVPQDTVDAIREDRTPSSLTDEETLVTQFCSQMVSGDHRVGHETYRQALRHFGAQGLVEMVVTLAYFAMIALPLNAFEIEMSPAQTAQRKPFAPLPVSRKPWTADDAVSRPLPPLTTTVANAARLPLLSNHEALPPEHQHFFDRVIRTRGWIAPIFQLLLHTPDVAERIASIGDFFLYHTILPPLHKSLAWLIAARDLDCQYTWTAGVSAATTVGLDSGIISAIEHGEPLKGLTDEQQALAGFCLPLLRGNHHVPEASYQHAIQQFGVAGAVQIATAVGYIAMMSLIANAFDLAPAIANDQPAL